MKNSLASQGYVEFNFIGDFNADATNFKTNCGKIKGFDPIINTYSGQGQSCSSNKGDHAPENIDLLMHFSGT